MYCFVNNIKIKKVENFDKRMDITRPVYLPSHYRTQDVSKYSSLGTALAPFYTSRVLNSRVNNVTPKYSFKKEIFVFNNLYFDSHTFSAFPEKSLWISGYTGNRISDGTKLPLFYDLHQRCIWEERQTCIF